ncbi:hypothetical protein EDD17DRAFT_1598390 [Pisolithus thermaeus]|nr:hypothetical protein EDD17DRAFT_1598390 [Pisolithus thermaeus]
MLAKERTESYLPLPHPFSDDDWSIIPRLSSRVRRLYIDLEKLPLFDYAANDAAPQCFCPLTSPPDSSFLFQNLRAVSFHMDHFLNFSPISTQDPYRPSHLLLRPHLSALRLEMPSPFYTYLDISSIPVLCPNIHMLSLAKGTHHCEIVPVQDEFMRRFFNVHHLETVRSNATSWDLLSSLAEAKGLRKL